MILEPSKRLLDWITNKTLKCCQRKLNLNVKTYMV